METSILRRIFFDENQHWDRLAEKYGSKIRSIVHKEVDKTPLIGRYIRRPAIVVGRIEEYDGNYVTFRYTNKTDGQEKTETVTAEEFIARLIRHIPDEHFKTIRYFGVSVRVGPTGSL